MDISEMTDTMHTTNYNEMTDTMHTTNYNDRHIWNDRHNAHYKLQILLDLYE